MMEEKDTRFYTNSVKTELHLVSSYTINFTNSRNPILEAHNHNFRKKMKYGNTPCLLTWRLKLDLQTCSTFMKLLITAQCENDNTRTSKRFSQNLSKLNSLNNLSKTLLKTISKCLFKG